jgi:hypothetical protein
MIADGYNPILFLDFDGVLNSAAFFRSPESKDGEAGALDPKAVARLNTIIAKTGAKVVVSSSWRYGRSVAELQAILDERGFVGEVIDKTADAIHMDAADPKESGFYRAYARGDEIREWLDRHPEVKSFVALDDDWEMDAVKENHVKTNTFVGGLLDHHVEEAIRILERE